MIGRQTQATDAEIIATSLTDDGQWVRLFGATGRADDGMRPALFLDRDGVMIAERNYLRRSEDVALIDGCATTIATATASGFRVVVVTNQSGIGRGYFGWQDYFAVEQQMLHLLSQSRVSVDAILACPNHTDGMPPYDTDHPWRKPNPGMLLTAAERLDLDLSRSLIVGDKATDLAAGRAAGLRLGLHVATGHGNAHERRAACELASPTFDVRACESIRDVPRYFAT